MTDAACWAAVLALAAGPAGGAPDGGAGVRQRPPAGEVVQEPGAGGAPPTAAEVPHAVPSTGPAFAAPRPGKAATVDPGGAVAPRPARGQSVPAAPDPITGLAPSPAAQASPQPSADLQACVDDQLARRGLNAYGEPAGTAYRNGPPVPEGSNDRYRRVLEREPAIRTACEASPAFR